MKKQILFGKDAQEKMLAGLAKTAAAVKSTLGPRGKNVLIENHDGSYHFTKDGITVAKAVEFEDPIENLGAQIAKDCANSTAKDAGDGSTTSIVLLDAIVKSGAKQIALGTDPASLRRGLDAAQTIALSYIKEQSTAIRDKEDVARVATISANNNKMVGDLIAEIITKIGPDATVTLQDAVASTTSFAITNGWQMPKGTFSNHFIADKQANKTQYFADVRSNSFAKEDSRFSLKTKEPIAAYVWIIPGRLNALTQCLDEFTDILQKIHTAGVPLVLFADSLEGDSFRFLADNAVNNNLKITVVQNPGFAADRKDLLEDLAAFTGAKLRNVEFGEDYFTDFDLSELGVVSSAVITPTSTLLTPLQKQVPAITTRAKQIKTLLDQEKEETEKFKLRRRMSMLAGGTAIINIGGRSLPEVKEQHDLFEDALLAARAATKEGISVGAGTTLLRTAQALEKHDFSHLTQDEMAGVIALTHALKIPIQAIVENGGGSQQVVLDSVLKSDDLHFGYDSKMQKFTNLLDAGIIDPTAVLRCVITNATGTAGLLLSTDAIITKDIK